MSAFRGATKVDFANGEDAPGAQPNPPLELLAFTDGAVPWLEDAWLVEDVLPNKGLGVIFAAPGSRKTFTAIDFALRLAGGCSHWRRSASGRASACTFPLKAVAGSATGSPRGGSSMA